MVAYWCNSLRIDMSLPAPLGHIILNMSHPALDLTSECFVVIRETANTDSIAFAQTRPGLETTIYSLPASTQAITSDNAVCPLATDHTRKFFPPLFPYHKV